MKSHTSPTIIATHNGLFHIDEIAAFALLVVFNKISFDKVKLIRTRDANKIKQADIVLDVGGEYSSDNLRFDHHQLINGTLSTAGLVWQWIKENQNISYHSIDKLIIAIDKHDCGIEMMPEFSLAQIVSSLNGDIHDDTAQLNAFKTALNVVITFIASLKSTQDELLCTQKIIESAKIHTFKDKSILELPSYCQGWKQFIHGESELAFITHVIWYVEHKEEWCVQVPRINEENLTLNHPSLKQDKNSLFVHQNGFIAFYKLKETLLNAVLN